MCGYQFHKKSFQDNELICERRSIKKDHAATKIPFMYSIPFLEIARFQSQFPHSCVCEQFIPRNGPHISCSRIGKSLVGIQYLYESLTDTWMWKLGLWPRESFSGHICFKFSVLVLCSASVQEPGKQKLYLVWKTAKSLAYRSTWYLFYAQPKLLSQHTEDI